MSNEYKLVPVVPTEAMLKAGMMYLGTREDGLTPIYMEKEDVLDCYKAMLAASPAHDGEVVYQWRDKHVLANKPWYDSDKSACEAMDKTGFHETRVTYTAPPRVVDMRESLHNAVALFRPFCSDSTQRLWLEQATKALEQAE